MRAENCQVVLMVLLLTISSAFSGQSVTVKGQVFCPSDPQKAAGVKVKLFDDDAGNDDDMAMSSSNSRGEISVSGSATDPFGGRIDPHIKIFHKCAARPRGCIRVWQFGIHHRHINRESIDIGRLNLEMKVEDEKLLC